MAQFEATTTDVDGVLRVALAGECDLAVSDRLRAVLSTAVHTGRPVLVDLSGLAFLDSSGVHNLVTAHHAARARGGRLAVVNARGAVATVLELTGVGALLGDPPGTAGAGGG